MKSRFIFAVLLMAGLSLAGARAEAQGRPFSIILSNRCDIAVSVAVRTLQNGQWTTMAWAQVQPRKVLLRSLFTQNRIFYLWAQSDDGRFKWSGADRAGSVMKPIISKSFKHTAGPLEGADLQTVSFRKLTILPSKRNYTFRFRCTR